MPWAAFVQSVAAVNCSLQPVAQGVHTRLEYVLPGKAPGGDPSSNLA